MRQSEQIQEIANCFRSAAYFIFEYCKILEITTEEKIGGWVPFELWPEQVRALGALEQNKLVVLLKARQLGLTWLCLAFALWLLIFRAPVTILLFSLRDTEAIQLLDTRFKGMYNQLPDFLKVGLRVEISNKHEFKLSNGSHVLAFPTTAGDSYTASLAIVDEADLVPDLDRLMRAVKPTIDAGGRMVLLSRADKSRPVTRFKQIYRAAKAKLSNWFPVFLPWDARPERTPAWYERVKADIFSSTGSLDELHEQYPATDTEALAPRTLDKRIPPDWLEKVYEEAEPLDRSAMLLELPTDLSAEVRKRRYPYLSRWPAIPSLLVYELPQRGREYVVGGDTAEGNVNSNESAAVVCDKMTGAVVAICAGRFQPNTFGDYIAQLSHWYNFAAVLVERNLHGHAVLLWLAQNYSDLPGLTADRLLTGLDDKMGWLSNPVGKMFMYNTAAEAVRDEDTTIRNFELFSQLASIEGSTLKAPETMPDDRSDAYALAQVARAYLPPASDEVIIEDDPVRISEF